jgi:hypothetical protein
MTSPVEELAIKETHDPGLSSNASVERTEFARSAASMSGVYFPQDAGAALLSSYVPPRHARSVIAARKAAFATILPARS